MVPMLELLLSSAAAAAASFGSGLRCMLVLSPAEVSRGGGGVALVLLGGLAMTDDDDVGAGSNQMLRTQVRGSLHAGHYSFELVLPSLICLCRWCSVGCRGMRVRRGKGQEVGLK